MFRFTAVTFLALTAFAATTTSAGAGESRSAHAHTHGHGKLAIAIEGNRVLMELEVPGADIVGFEHAPATAGEKAAIRAAEEKLEDGGTLFTFIGGDCHFGHGHIEDEHGHDEAHGHDGKHGHDEKHASDAAEEHSEFHVGYEITCKDASGITAIAFPFFSTFKGSEELEVTLVSENGQSRHEVEREAARLALDN